MRQVAKYVSPIIVLLGLVSFPGNQSRFVLPACLEILSISSIFLLCNPLRSKPNASALLLFWLAPLALLWLMSERREGRDIGSLSIGIEIGLAGIGTAFLVSKDNLKKSDWKVVLLIFLTWGVAYLSGASGGADKMHPMFSFLHLTIDQLNTLVMVVRKAVHLTFYGSITWLLATYLWNQVSNWRTLLSLLIAFPLLIAISDEFRQSMMPNRQGSLFDVFLDMSATFIVLVVLLFLERKKQRNATVR